MDYDLIVLGAGSAGYATAIRATQLGMKVALAEGDKVGGTCLHRGCIPTKSLVQCAKAAHIAKNASKFGVINSFSGVDINAVNVFKNGIVESKYRGLQSLLRSYGIHVYPNFATLSSQNSVRIGTEDITGKNIVIATGSRPKGIPGLSGGCIFDSDSILEIDHLPSSLAIIGGGVIGVEFASIFNYLGVDVSILEAQETLIPSEERGVSKQLERVFRRRGIKLYLGHKIMDVSQTDGVVVSLDSNEKVNADLLLVAIGRAPATDAIGKVGIEIDGGAISVDEKLRTSVPNVFAAGDVVGGLQLAHRGYQQGIYLAEQIAGLDPSAVADINIPRVIYTSPEVASVGYTEAGAAEIYGVNEIVTYEYNLAGNAKSSIMGAAGSIKVVQHKNKDVLGVHMVGDGVSELVSEAQLIVNWEANPSDVASLIHPHPTQAEAIGEAMLALAGKPLHGI
ncbi:dihydrolipoyl dehydrogenase [Tropheryma whipplei]|uniref:Dihydrolipoyl dehydrogenase n=1 Tax=Tropheryma whipplei (strain Twist) TaxID=203267 RepID=Q83G31_TROWT|nr:dihydrolipoyl dehydrogenase [Tropheryma whipplei]AAO44599.1 dihydrolipoamide dehydrogenase [Tropheryma whipplei str. Twist]